MGGVNFYSYVGNNPVNFRDWLGLWKGAGADKDTDIDSDNDTDINADADNDSTNYGSGLENEYDQDDDGFADYCDPDEGYGSKENYFEATRENRLRDKQNQISNYDDMLSEWEEGGEFTSEIAEALLTNSSGLMEDASIETAKEFNADNDMTERERTFSKEDCTQ